jgi:hypothetical protein
MDVSTCRTCGAELVPQTSFCRQCGAAIASGAALASDERPTALFDEPHVIATQRLDPRQTTPQRLGLNVSPSPVSPAVKPANKSVLIGIVLLLVLAAIVSTVAVVRNRIRSHSHSHSASSEGLIYPSARKIMDVVADGGGRAVTLETSESFEKVDEWYRSTLKPEKVVQLTTGSVVMKNEKITATIIGDNEKTLILLKILP